MYNEHDTVKIDEQVHLATSVGECSKFHSLLLW